MILDVRHSTKYEYAQAAAFSQHLLRLTPQTNAAQRCVVSSISITPEPDGIAAHTDAFGNTVHVATVSRPHEVLEIVSTARVDRAERTALIFDAAVPWEETRSAALSGPGQSPSPDVSIFAFPSEMSRADGDIEAYAAESLKPGVSVLAAAMDLCTRIYEDFEYMPGTTSAETLPVESFHRREGVCQDFAHVMLAALRAWRVPARYVSGYLRTIPPEGQPRLQGADASHAWVSVWEPALGWVDFDPTNNCVPAQDHVAIAHGRDFRDVSPVAGVVVGAGAQMLKVGVDVVAQGGER